MILPEEKKMFYTPVWEYRVEDHEELNALLHEDVVRFTPGKNFLQHEGAGAAALSSIFKEAAREVARRHRWIRPATEFRGRVNPIEPLELDTPHFHPDARLVGVYYLSVPRGSGDILLHDPRGFTNWNYDVAATTVSDNSPTEESYKSARAYHRITPTEGLLLLHPSYLVHSVEPNLSSETRISIAMVAN